MSILIKEIKMELFNVPLSQLSISNKLYLMEALWDDLSRDETSIESPDWHKDILMNRKKALANGKAIVSDLEEAKIRIRNNVLEKYLW
jgi:putative addiction module component (TIGR02574 family)